MEKEFAKEYATALFDMSLEDNYLDEIKGQLNFVAETIADNNDFRKLISHPQLSNNEKKEILKNVFKNISSKLLYLLYVVIDNNRGEDIEYINEEFRKLYNMYYEILIAEAQTTVPMTEEEKQHLSRNLEAKYRHKIEIRNVINPDIYGGMLLKINNEVLDYSIKSQLQNLKLHILKQK